MDGLKDIAKQQEKLNTVLKGIGEIYHNKVTPGATQRLQFAQTDMRRTSAPPLRHPPTERASVRRCLKIERHGRETQSATAIKTE